MIKAKMINKSKNIVLPFMLIGLVACGGGGSSNTIVEDSNTGVVKPEVQKRGGSGNLNNTYK